MADAAKSDSTVSSDGINLDVDLEKDTLENSDQPPGLSAVYAGKACAAAADDIADRLINATRAHPFDVLIVTGGSILADSELATALRFEVAAFQDRLMEVQVDTEAVLLDGHGERLQIAAGNRSLLFPPMIVAPVLTAALGALPGGVGLLSRLVAHQYTTSSATLDNVALGWDLRVAGAIRAKLGDSEAAHVTVERFWHAPSSTLIDGLTKLAHAHRQLATMVAQAAARSEHAKAAVDDAMATKAAANTRLCELSKIALVHPTPAEPNAWSIAWDHASSLARTDVAGLARAHADAEAVLTELRTLHSDLETFIASTLAAPPGGSSNLARAMRAEWLVADPSRVLLYVGPLAAGVDQVMATKFGSDRRVVLAGTSVEYAAVASNSELMFAGVFDSLWGGNMKLDKLSDFRSERIDYVPVPNARRTGSAT